MSGSAFEVNFDGLVGPTHNYAGLSPGNLASQASTGQTSNPKAAALEGLAKMKLLADLGVRQAVLPPHPRPDMSLLHRFGFDNVETAGREAPYLLAAAYSASSMWAANAATVCPSIDSRHRKVVFTPANLVTELHRSIEAPMTARILKAIFPAPEKFLHLDPLPAEQATRDEGAANHTRLCTDYGEPGVQLFVYGEGSAHYPARQAKLASEMIAHNHGVNNAVFAAQNPDSIDKGVFHNDVIAVADRDLLFCHEDAYVNAGGVIDELRRRFEPLRAVVVQRDELSVDEAVRTYLFNSQIVELPDGSTALIALQQCAESEMVQAVLAGLDDFDHIHYADVRQSMKNGGGPACLRLRVVLTEQELAATHPGVMFTPALYNTLCAWVHKHYRDHLTPADLRDPSLADECWVALDELTGILSLSNIYPFQNT